jgi:hypothetical protein
VTGRAPQARDDRALDDDAGYEARETTSGGQAGGGEARK